MMLLVPLDALSSVHRRCAEGNIISETAQLTCESVPTALDLTQSLVASSICCRNDAIKLLYLIELADHDLSDHGLHGQPACLENLLN